VDIIALHTLNVLVIL